MWACDPPLPPTRSSIMAHCFERSIIQTRARWHRLIHDAAINSILLIMSCNRKTIVLNWDFVLLLVADVCWFNTDILMRSTLAGKLAQFNGRSSSRLSSTLIFFSDEIINYRTIFSRSNFFVLCTDHKYTIRDRSRTYNEHLHFKKHTQYL